MYRNYSEMKKDDSFWNTYKFTMTEKQSGRQVTLECKAVISYSIAVLANAAIVLRFVIVAGSRSNVFARR